MNFSRGAMPGVSEQPSTSASAAVTFPGPFGDVVNGETTYDADKASDAGVASTGAGSSFVGGGNRPSSANGNGPGSMGSEAQLVSRNHRDGETAPTETRELVATAAATAPETAGALKMGTNLYDVAWSDEEQVRVFGFPKSGGTGRFAAPFVTIYVVTTYSTYALFYL